MAAFPDPLPTPAAFDPAPADPGPTDRLLLGSRLARHGRRLRLLLTHLAGHAVRSRVEVEDLLQEVYLRALAAPGGLPKADEGEDALWRFLAHLARNAVIDCARALRTAKRSAGLRSLDRSDWSHAPAAGGPGPATAAGAAEASRLLVQRFLALSGEHRRVIGLRQFEGLSARESAARMGRSEAAIYSLYRRALMAWGIDEPESPS